MPCLAIVFAVFVPRLTLFVMWLVGYSGHAFDSYLWPIVGFFFMPFTTCAYVIGMNEAGGFKGWSLLMLIIAVFMDLGGHGGTAKARHRQRSVHIQ